MLHVVFVIPFVMESSLRFARAAAGLSGVRLSIVSQDAAEKVPDDLRQQLVAHRRVDDALDSEQLVAAIAALGKEIAPVDRLLGILEPLQEPLAAVRERLRIRGMDTRAARNFRDKARMKEVLQAHGIGTAKHRLCASAAEAEQFAAAIGFPLVAKPPAGAGAKATSRCKNAADLAAFLAATRPGRGREVLLEEFVQGREFSFDSVTIGGKHVFHNISSYHPTPLQVMENPWIQWCVVLPRDIDGPEFEAIHRFGPAALSALGMWTGMTHMEWFQRKDGSIAIGEVGARPPGAQFTTLMSYAHDCDMYQAYAQLMVFETFAPPERRFATGAAYLRGQGQGSVRAVNGLEEVRRELGPIIVESRLPRIGQPQSASYEGEGYVIVRHPDTAVVAAAVDRIVTTLRVELGS
ncbi:MAG: ATP-grasp domain-containing protein [Planctomycetes bacterium]|nr:ATP-grasp domain-containing protein [Planctomycetota bacterium]